jgi:hypothetical protein
VGELELMGRHAEGGAEEPDEPEFPHAGGVGELFEGDVGAQPVAEVVAGVT